MPDEAFYLPTPSPGVYLATAQTVGPWTPEHQHAGPPSALLTREIERLPSSIDGPSQVTRLTVDILGPVATGEVRVSATVTRPGRGVELIDASLEAGGRPAMRARAWRIRQTKLDLPPGLDAHLQPPPPLPPATEAEETASASLRADPAAEWGDGYLGAVEWRYVHGQLWKPGPAAAWTRLRIPLVTGEEPTPTQRLAAVADSGNGLSSLLNPDRWWFINTDLTVHLHRVPVGEWIFMDARSTLDPSGIGLAETELYDATGRVGRGAQALLVGPRT